MDDDKPPARRFVLKPKEVDPTEKPSVLGDGTLISAALMHRENEQAEAKALARKEGEAAAAHLQPQEAAELPAGFKAKELDPLNPPAIEGDDSAIRVHDMLRQNRRAAALKVPELIAMPKRRVSRRTRDFLILVGVAGGCAALLCVGFRHDREVIALALGSIAFITLALAWILYGVMDNY